MSDEMTMNKYKNKNRTLLKPATRATNKKLPGPMDGSLSRRVDESMHRRVDESMSRWVDGSAVDPAPSV